MEKLIFSVFADRKPESHKGDFGKLLVIGGSRMFTGAPALSALAALNTGCDVVTVAAPVRAADIIAGFSPNMITYPLDGDYLGLEHVDTLIELAGKADAVVIGPGLGSVPGVFSAVVGFLSKVKVPCVVDADAIGALGSCGKKVSGKFIITPHAGEFFELTGKKVAGLKEDDTQNLVRQAAKDFGAAIILKGQHDVVSDGKDVFVNQTGNPYMTKGGTGDVLAGICGALLARGLSMFDAARLGAYISGLAGDVAAAVNGECLLATDVIDSIANVINVSPGLED